MTLRRAIRWFGRDPIELTQTLNNAVSVTGVAPGLYAITATVAGRAATSAVTVPMEALSVTANQTLVSQWHFSLINGQLNNIILPSGNPAWGGDPNGCNQATTTSYDDENPLVGHVVFYWDQVCAYDMTISVEAPRAGLPIVRYRYRSLSFVPPTFPRVDFSPSRSFTLERTGLFEPLPNFAGWGSVIVEGQDSNGRVLATGHACVQGC
jgi:hypothetical protein